ncbi:outer membrane protein assembly factor BamA [Bradymonas sediminis]|uniref:outer membrane protein assembly factor BamA n=1 Tax=Bradymonas sediminis TaxID=1548548 RepID=UPI0010EB92A6|nr:outer membrane protein assembly factor BamA [Bradymonas sediminis]TDP71827.1 Beta-barrel assembly machine subunit BamA [Bradymonas sediminis]
MGIFMLIAMGFSSSVSAQSLPGGVGEPTDPRAKGINAREQAKLESYRPVGDATVPKGKAGREGQTIDVIQVVGNVRVESESVLHKATSAVGQPLDLGRISKDIQSIHGLGYFNDVQVDATTTDDGQLVVSYIVSEKPAIAEIRYEGNEELDLEDIGEVVDLKRFAILDIAKVKNNAEKIRELYASKGYYLAEVDYKLSHKEGREDLSIVTFEINEFAKVEVKKVTFLGNENLGDDELSAIMATREGSFLSFLSEMGTFKEKEFEADLQRITAFYYNHGFVEVSVNMPSIRLSRDKRYLYITIRIDEGDQYSVGNVDVEGDLLSERDELMDLVSLETDAVFNYGQMRQDIESLSNLYRNAGYAYVNITPLTRMDSTNHTVDLSYDIKQGAQVYFGRIEIVGNQKTRDYVIRRELRIEEGELYSAAKMRASEARVGRLGYFDKVEITTQPGERPDLINARIEVNETRTGTFQVGAGFSSTESFIANAQISQANLLGRGQNLSLQFQLSSIRTLFNIKFTEPWLLGTRWNSSVNLYNFEYAFQDFIRTSTGGDLTFGYPLSEVFDLNLDGDLVASLTYKLENVDIQPGGRNGSRGGAESSTLFQGGFTSSVRGGLFYDNRDNVRFPTSGQFHSGKVEFADRLVTLSQNEYLKFDFETRWYFPIVWDFVLRLQGELGYVMNPDPKGTVPLFERYFVGGPSTVRGFERYTLGPIREVASNSSDPGSSLDEFRVGGNKSLVFTAEVEFPIFTAAGIKGVVFADMGNSFDNDQKFSLVPDLLADPINDYEDALRTSAGFGIRWLSPIAPLRFEWGFPLSRLRGEQPMVFEFSIANAF